MSDFLTRLLVALLWCLHWLPLPGLRYLGRNLGRFLFMVAKRRRHVVLTNLRLCFPDKTEDERQDIAKKHFIAFAQSALDRTLGWWAPRERLERIIRLRGAEHLHDPKGRPVIMLTPHFVGLDAGGTAVSLRLTACSVFSNQSNKVINDLLYNGRRRFNPAILLSRQEGMRKIVRSLKDGHPLYYLPDMDFGPQESIFVPFFGVQAATSPALSRLSRMVDAVVVPVVCKMTPTGYDIEVQPAWTDFPGASMEEDTRTMNAFIEREVLRMPEQYYWVHKRFKSRPNGEASLY